MQPVLGIIIWCMLCAVTMDIIILHVISDLAYPTQTHRVYLARVISKQIYSTIHIPKLAFSLPESQLVKYRAVYRQKKITRYDTSTNTLKTVQYLNNTDTDILETKCRHILVYQNISLFFNNRNKMQPTFSFWSFMILFRAHNL